MLVDDITGRAIAELSLLVEVKCGACCKLRGICRIKSRVVFSLRGNGIRHTFVAAFFLLIFIVIVRGRATRCNDVLCISVPRKCGIDNLGQKT